MRQIIEPYLRHQSELYKEYVKPQVDRQLELRDYLDNFQAIQIDFKNNLESIYEDLLGSFKTYYSEELLKRPIEFKVPPKPRSQELVGKLSACPPGRENWKEFEDICREIFTFLFVPPLAEPLVQLRTETRLQIRELVFPIPCGMSGFWGYVQDRYKATALIVECKNYSGPIEGNDVVIFSKYLGDKRLGSFGIILSRQPVAQSAVGEMKRLWDNEGKLILCLDDENIKEMIRLKNEGKDPELLIEKTQLEFFASLE